MDTRKRIYCVEDEKNIRELLVYALNSKDFIAEGFEDGETFWEAVHKAIPDLVLLDIMLPGEDGLTILSKIRGNKETKELPVILLTAKGSEFDKVHGLDAGADDYVAKPFGVMELMSRIRAVLRRNRQDWESPVLQVGEIKMNREERWVQAQGRELQLTFKEFELLRFLMENENMVLSRDKLLDVIWGYDSAVETRTVDVHIRTLRQKLGDQGEWIETVRNVGYRIGRRA
ncbi:MAG TPA: response regulator transcription factor [Bacillota bacterium]|nr:response regulator transcription factor [Bacillota bacterium]